MTSTLPRTRDEIIEHAFHTENPLDCPFPGEGHQARIWIDGWAWGFRERQATAHWDSWIAQLKA